MRRFLVIFFLMPLFPGCLFHSDEPFSPGKLMADRSARRYKEIQKGKTFFLAVAPDPESRSAALRLALSASNTGWKIITCELPVHVIPASVRSGRSDAGLMVSTEKQLSALDMRFVQSAGSVFLFVGPASADLQKMLKKLNF